MGKKYLIVINIIVLFILIFAANSFSEEIPNFKIGIKDDTIKLEYVYCYNCGYKYLKTFKFCPHCGAENNLSKNTFKKYKFNFNFFKNFLNFNKILFSNDKSLKQIKYSLLKSAVLPGWGQLAENRGTNFAVISSLTLAELGMIIYTNNKTEDYYERYNNSLTFSDLKYNKEKTRDYKVMRDISLALFGITYFINLMDITNIINNKYYYIFHETDLKTKSKYTGIKFKIKNF